MKTPHCLLFLMLACGPTPVPNENIESDAGLLEAAPDAGVDAGVDGGTKVVDAGHKADGCASTFGSLFTNAFGRADGTVTAVVPPAWKCPLENGDHVVPDVNYSYPSTTITLPHRLTC